MARPRKVQPGEHVPTEESREFAREMYLGGTTLDELSTLMEIDILTLIKYYRHDLDLSFNSMRAALADNLYQKAMAGDNKSQEFWLKTRGRWSNYKPPEEVARDNHANSLLADIRDTLKAQAKE